VQLWEASRGELNLGLVEYDTRQELEKAMEELRNRRMAGSEARMCAYGVPVAPPSE